MFLENEINSIMFHDVLCMTYLLSFLVYMYQSLIVSFFTVNGLATYTTNLSFGDMENKYSWLGLGGRYTPDTCLTTNKVAIIVPYRNRESHLKTFLQNIHPFLRRQLLDYGIYIVEQVKVICTCALVIYMQY